MDALPIHLVWYKDKKGYQIKEYGKDKKGDVLLSIVGMGGQLIETRPFESELVFKAFASMAQSPQGLLEFVNVYGLLVSPAYDVAIPTGGGVEKHYSGSGRREGEDVGDHLKTAKVFRDILRQSDRGWKNVSSLLEETLFDRLSGEPLAEVCLIGDRARGFRLVLIATSLVNAMWLQLARKIAGGAGFRSCVLCGALFEVGPKTGRRADAIFCSDAHQKAHNSRKRSRSL